ncbi:MAG: 50S ribosomal protein L5 [Ignavibacteria bacterium]|jgi:large subunit ribosomal protein L5|nr:50S ribosomal protein L5 [Ignavibacteria bacterium]MBK6876727.1 50S ribosomal protein L5 [Ignavibacteria bacterium]MBK9229092.1 50S ribosomal protein L5 [Ignavibacteria bacterium]
MAKTKQDRKKDPDAPAKGTEKQEKKSAEHFVEEKVPIRLLSLYREKVVPELVKKFSYKNVMEAPRLQKISINVGVGMATQDPKLIDTTVKELEAITGQKPAVVKAKKSVSNFKLREGVNIGVRVTLRNARMFEFLDRFVNVAIPRIRDFRGLPDKSFDGRGNYTLGVKEQIIFPEINVDNVNRISGMDITFVTSAKTDEESLELLKGFGLPFMSKQSKN